MILSRKRMSLVGLFLIAAAIALFYLLIGDAQSANAGYSYWDWLWCWSHFGMFAPCV